MAVPRFLNNNETLIAPHTEIQSNQRCAVTNTAGAQEKSIKPGCGRSWRSPAGRQRTAPAAAGPTAGGRWDPPSGGRWDPLTRGGWDQLAGGRWDLLTGGRGPADRRQRQPGPLAGPGIPVTPTAPECRRSWGTGGPASPPADPPPPAVLPWMAQPGPANPAGPAVSGWRPQGRGCRGVSLAERPEPAIPGSGRQLRQCSWFAALSLSPAQSAGCR
jgi:hypothetical protein